MASQLSNQTEQTFSAQRRPRPQRDLQAMEDRRMQAADLFGAV
jgi:hypothetical protein